MSQITVNKIQGLTTGGNANTIVLNTSSTDVLTVNSSGNVSMSGDLTVDTSTLHVDSTNNRVGIGTASPSHLIHAVGADSSRLIVAENATGVKTGIGQGTNDGRIGNITNHGLVFLINDTEKARITTAGQFRLSSAGITFNGDSATDNELDDYEEGTWNPALQTGIPGSPAAVVSSANCRYVKIGGFVQASAYFQAANDGTNIQIGGLPFASSKYSSFSLGHQNKTVSFERMDNGNTHVNFTLSGTNTSLQEWYFSIQYYTTS